MNPLEPYLPYIKYALIAIIPALFVYLIEQSNVSSLKIQLAAAQQENVISKPVHLFTAKDTADLSKLEVASVQMTQGIDSYRPVSNNMNEFVCMQGMRNSAASYIANMITQLRQQLNMSLNSTNQDDVKFADRQMLGTVTSTLRFLPNIRQNIQQMNQSCSTSQTVKYTNSVILRVLDQMVPYFTSIQSRIITAK